MPFDKVNYYCHLGHVWNKNRQTEGCPDRCCWNIDPKQLKGVVDHIVKNKLEDVREVERFQVFNLNYAKMFSTAEYRLRKTDNDIINSDDVIKEIGMSIYNTRKPTKEKKARIKATRLLGKLMAATEGV